MSVFQDERPSDVEMQARRWAKGGAMTNDNKRVPSATPTCVTDDGEGDGSGLTHPHLHQQCRYGPSHNLQEQHTHQKTNTTMNEQH